jgi:SUKH-4 immunity protein
MTTEEWKNSWPPNQLMEPADKPELPLVAREFLRTHGLPKVVVFEAVGDNASMAFEWSFHPLTKELATCNKLIRWGDFYEAKRDQLWSHQLAIGEEEFCNGGASICVHTTDEYVTRIDCEREGLGWFMNSSLPQLAESILAAIQWSAKIRRVEKKCRRPLYAELLRTIAQIDSAITEGGRELEPFWPNILDALDDDEELVSFEITSDPACSKPRF